MKLKERPWGNPESELFGKCEICGRPIARNLKRCMRCSTMSTSPTKKSTSRSSSRGWVLLLFLLIAGAIYWFSHRGVDSSLEPSADAAEIDEFIADGPAPPRTHARPTPPVLLITQLQPRGILDSQLVLRHDRLPSILIFTRPRRNT
jgi:hypothetical protein